MSEELQRSLTRFNHNWARCLNIIKAYRDWEEDFDLSELEKDFKPFESGNLSLTANYRIYTVTRTHEFWMVYQAALSFLDTADSKVVKEIPAAIAGRLKTERLNNATHAEVAEECFTQAKKLQDESHRFYELAGALQDVAYTLERERLRFKDLENLGNNENIASAVARLREKFPEEVKVRATDA